MTMPPEKISLVRDDEFAEWLVAAASDDPKYPQYIRADIAEKEIAELASDISDALKTIATLDAQNVAHGYRIKALEDALRAIVDARAESFETMIAIGQGRPDIIAQAILAAAKLLDQPK